MANIQTVFERKEKKFLLSNMQYEALRRALEPHMQIDQYGLHTIGSIYYDTNDFSIIRHSLDKPAYKEKLRLRCYGTPKPGDTVFLELKKKYMGVTYKRRVPATLFEAERYLRGGAPFPADPQILGEIDWFIKTHHPIPKILLSYERIALFDKAQPQQRITFDANIRYRHYNLELGKGVYGTTLIPPDTRLMEIKTDRALPLYLSRLLSELSIYAVSFSKYGRAYYDFLQQEAVSYAG